MIIPVLVTTIIIALFIGVSYLNKQTPAPVSASPYKVDEATCSACSNYSCAVKQQFEEER